MPSSKTTISDRSNGTSSIDASVGLRAFFGMWIAAALASSIVLVAAGSANSDDGSVTSIPVLAMSLMAGWTAYALGTWLTSRRFGSGNFAADFGLSARPIDAIGVPIGVAAQLLLIPAIYIPLRAIWPGTFSDQALSETAEELIDRADGGLLVLLFILVVLGAPLFEEIVYRGVLQRPLLGAYSTIPVIVIVAAVFALIHFRPIEYPGLFAVGLVFGVCAWRTNRLGMAFAAHVGFNATGLILAL
ncbi:MAG: membrane protease YdiL (CAAX protease family) [Ilumatobacter sp.]